MQNTPATSPNTPHSNASSAPADDFIIRLVNISKSFGPLNVLRNLNLQFQRGKTTVVLGPSGTGKSVMLKHIVGLLQPDEGEVWFENQRVDQLSERQLVEIRTRFGFLFQMGALFDSMPVEQNIFFPLAEHTHMTLAEQQQRCADVLDMVGLGGAQKKMPAELSGGQRKRIALARAIALHPDVILYDEPTTGLDPIRADGINEQILKLQRQLKVTSIVVTHDLASAFKIADRIVMLYDGHILADGSAHDIQHSTDPFVKAFVEGRSDIPNLDTAPQNTNSP